MENGPGLKMCFLLNMGIFHCYVSLPEGSRSSKWPHENCLTAASWGFKSISTCFFTSAFIHRKCHIPSQDFLQLNKVEDMSLNCWSCTLWKTKMDLKTYQKLVVLRLLAVFFLCQVVAFFSFALSVFSTAGGKRQTAAKISHVSRAMRDPMLYRRASRKRKLGFGLWVCLGDVPPFPP